MIKKDDIINFILVLGPFSLLAIILGWLVILDKSILACKSEADCKIQQIKRHEKEVQRKVITNCFKEFDADLCREFNYSPTAIKLYYNISQ